MNEMILLIGGVGFLIGFLVGHWLGKEKGVEEGRKRGKEEGFLLGERAGRGAAMPLPDLPAGTYTVVNTIEGKGNGTVVFFIIRLPKDGPLYDLRGEVLTVTLPKGSEPLPAPPFLLTKNPDGSYVVSRPRAGTPFP